MPREDFDLQLNQLQQEVETLAQIVGKSINRAVDALKRRDIVASQEVSMTTITSTRSGSKLKIVVLDMIATQQPMAGDLRAIISLLHIVVELERMGDYAEGIAKISLSMGDAPPLKPLIDIPRMAEKATTCWRTASTHYSTETW
ncbi:MAG: hypothetical protein Ct9H300mP11_26540 [Chloroflexota bacterium]|nr:MAG: hypothetical protein Ct9H300mP11_26540 [Chloroflexota bacterium]